MLWVLLKRAPLGSMGGGQRELPQHHVTHLILLAIQSSILFHLCVFGIKPYLPNLVISVGQELSLCVPQSLSQ